jgi:Ala-tRNA(Pro) deacylase
MPTKEPNPDLAATTAELADALRKADVEFELLPHRRTSTAAGEARVLHVAPRETAKTVVAQGEDVRVRAVVPASRHVDTHKLARVVGEEAVTLLTETELADAYPAFELGAVPPFGGPQDRVVVDIELAAQDDVVVEAGVHDTSLRLRAKDLLAVAQAEVADITRP